jgi:autotransporter-associated beta strand protein
MWAAAEAREEEPMTIWTWKQSPTDTYNDPNNWSGGVVPGIGDTAEFEASSVTNISVDLIAQVDEWLFNPGATQYNFYITFDATLTFMGSGIAINAGAARIVNFGGLSFKSSSIAGGALIDNFNILDFTASSNAEAATIHTFGGVGRTFFASHSTGGSAQLITDPGGIVDFSFSLGPDGLGHVSAGSIAGAGTYELGGDQLTVGLNGLSTEVSGPIEDGGGHGGVGASLVKVGPGTLKLSNAGNTYSGGTIVEAGRLDIAAVGAAGTGAITFAGVTKLEIENAALSGHHFSNDIDAFARHDFLDLAGLKFHTGAAATYHKASDRLTVHSGHVTDALTLDSPHGHHFGTASDGHGGTDVFLLHV